MTSPVPRRHVAVYRTISLALVPRALRRRGITLLIAAWAANRADQADLQRADRIMRRSRITDEDTDWT